MTAEGLEQSPMQAYGARKDSRLCGWGLFLVLWPIWKAAEARGKYIDWKNRHDEEEE